ncbi:hypothetical protein BT69DRAFT_1326882 [Atractiella rhizophila]|nr:hypothetical protein BT69DRAFT_1326882 [Atractiella rhizophila]
MPQVFPPSSKGRISLVTSPSTPVRPLKVVKTMSRTLISQPVEPFPLEMKSKHPSRSSAFLSDSAILEGGSTVTVASSRDHDYCSSSNQSSDRGQRQRRATEASRSGQSATRITTNDQHRALRPMSTPNAIGTKGLVRTSLVHRASSRLPSRLPKHATLSSMAELDRKDGNTSSLSPKGDNSSRTVTAQGRTSSKITDEHREVSTSVKLLIVEDFIMH